MALNSIVGALRVVLGLDSASFEDGLKKSKSSLGDFGAAVTTSAAAFAAAFAAAATGVALAVNSSVKEASKLGNIAKGLDMPVEKLSALKYAAERSGASFEDLQAGFTRLARTMAQANADTMSPMAQAFRSIGVSVQDSTGNLRNSGDVLLDIADKFSKMQNSASKTALAIKIFGDAGTTLLPLLNKGRAGIAELGDEARKLGLIVDDQLVAASKRYNDSMARMGREHQSLVGTLTKDVAPTMARIADIFTEIILKSDGLKSSLSTVGDTFKWIEGVLLNFGKAWEQVRTAWNAGAFTWGGVKDREKFEADLKAIEERYQGFQQAINSGRVGGFADAFKNMKEAAEKVKPPVEGLTEKLRELFQFNMSDPFAGIATKIDLINAAREAGAISALEKETLLRDLTIKGMDEVREAAKRNLEDIISSPIEGYTDKVRAIEEAWRSNVIQFGEFSKRMKEVKDEQANQMHELAGATSTALRTIFKESKGAAIAGALIDTASAVVKTLAKYGATPPGLALAALAAATGAAQIMAIKSASYGGSGGGGSVAAVPSASAASAETAAAEDARPSQALHIVGLNRNDLFSADAVRNLIGQINQLSRDGVYVTVAKA